MFSCYCVAGQDHFSSSVVKTTPTVLFLYKSTLECIRKSHNLVDS